MVQSFKKGFPDKKRVGGDNVDSSFEASDRIKMDMGHLEDHIKTNKKQSPKAEVQNSLKQEILQLEKRLQDQFEVRRALENAMGYRSSSQDNTTETVMPKPATELIKEIAVLELEVVYLEQYLLSLYRKAFDQQITISPSSKDDRLKSPINTPRARIHKASRLDITSKRESSVAQTGCESLDNPWKESNGIGGEEKLLDSGVHRCHSSLSQRSVYSTRTSPPVDSLSKALRACHSQPLSMMEYAQNTSSSIISLAEHLGTRISDHVPETANRLSEDMIKCMSAIYCKLADPPLTHNGLSSPNSSMSSMGAFSPQDQCDMWSPGFRNNSSFDVRLDNPFHVEGLKEFSGPYSTMVEVPWIYRDGQKLGDTEHLLQNFRSLICRLEEVAPTMLSHEEKLAFWINIHNALAYLAYGIPQKNGKRVFLLLKAAYNIGGHIISADTIQSSVLGCRMSRPGQPNLNASSTVFLSERAVPVAIFETDAEIMKHYVRRWCKISSDVGIRSIIDWSYYKQRLSSAIQKVITIPAAMQKVANPVPRVVHPDWLHKKVREKEDKFRQRKLVDIFSSLNRDEFLKKNSDAAGANGVMNEEIVKDLEDFGNKSRKSVNGPRPIVRCYEVNNRQNSVKTNDQVGCLQQQTDHRLPALSSENIDKNVDYRGWLELKKRKWKDSLERRKRQRLSNSRTPHRGKGVLEVLGDVTNRKDTQGRSGVSSYFKRHEVSLTRFHWQIIQLVPSSDGQFFAWVVLEGIMLKIPMTVPRVFYLNSKAPVTEEFLGRRVSKILPHGRRSFNLYEVIIDEDQFRKYSKKLAALLADPEVEGIYETKVPLEFNAILQIGCVCKVDKTAKKRNIQDAWSLSELHMKTTTECSYLEQSISFFYLYHSSSEGRAIYIGYFPASRTISVVVVNPYQNKDLSPSFLEKQFREACQALSIEPPPPRNGVIFKVDYVGYIKDAEKILQREINEYRHEHHGPTIAVIECPNALSMKSGIRALDDFPCVTIPSNARDSHYQVLGWQQVAAKIGMQRCAASSQWLNDRISLSRYAHVPVGNFELDWLVFTADLFFSRALRDQQQVLWISDDGVPDLGGINEEDTCFADEVHQPVLTYPGAYRKITVELKIHHLAVNALLKSNQVNEMEGGALLGYDQDMHSGAPFQNEHVGFDEDSACAPAFRVLKQLIQRCLADAVTFGNVYADAILQHLYRWLCSPESKLHDPALHRMLHKVMQKVFALLLAEFRKLGATIIFANFSKVIIDTGKFDLSAAKAYCDSLLKTLQKRDLFEWIELEPMNFWHSLLFMDQYNYGGIPAKADDIVPDESQVDIVSSWNIAEYLPKKIQDHFVFIVSQFMYIPWSYAQKQAAIRASLQDGNLSTPSVTVAGAENFESHMTEYLKGQISSYFTDKLLGIVRDTILHMKGMSKTENDQNISSGLPQFADKTHKGDAALEFIKHVCAVLALDQNVQHDVLVMRKNLLKFVRVREFAPEAEFHDPCPSFNLSNVICSYCNDCRELDLCRDTALLAQEWRCAVPQCGQPYDREVMENALLQIVRQRERLYHLQDLVCLRCNQVKAAHLAEQCACAGPFKCKEDLTEFRSKMQIFLKIAIHQKFQLLQECTSWILELR